MYKIGVIGSRDTVVGFKALGLDCYAAGNGEEAGNILRSLTKDQKDYAVIYIEETLAEKIMDEIDRFKDSPSPAIILIPGREGPIGIGQSALRSAVDRAVGIDILKD